jgi:hypothetical protein
MCLYDDGWSIMSVPELETFTRLGWVASAEAIGFTAGDYHYFNCSLVPSWIYVGDSRAQRKEPNPRFGRRLKGNAKTADVFIVS